MQLNQIEQARAQQQQAIKTTAAAYELEYNERKAQDDALQKQFQIQRDFVNAENKLTQDLIGAENNLLQQQGFLQQPFAQRGLVQQPVGLGTAPILGRRF